MEDLKTSYLDDILSASMGEKRKFRLTKADGSTEEVTIEDISEYVQVGSTFGAGDLNNICDTVNNKFDSDDVVDPMVATEEGFAADALRTKEALDEQNKKMDELTRKSTQVQLYDGDITALGTYELKQSIEDFNLITIVITATKASRVGFATIPVSYLKSVYNENDDAYNYVTSAFSGMVSVWFPDCNHITFLEQRILTTSWGSMKIIGIYGD